MPIFIWRMGGGQYPSAIETGKKQETWSENKA